MKVEKRIDPELRGAYAAMPRLDIREVEAARAWLADLRKETNAEPDSAVSVSNKYVPGPVNEPDVRIRIYQPREKAGMLPGLYWIHGGGYVLGTPEMNDWLCSRLVKEANCVVVSVDYRLAPENPFPAGVEDCYAGLEWFAAHAEELKVDSSRIGIAGASAGGGLAAAVTLMARDRKGPALAFQMPLYPMINDDNNTPSAFEITDNRVWSHDLNAIAWEMYLNGANGTEDVSPYAAPFREENLAGLPPAYTCVGQLDPFRDETIDYVTRLAKAGVDVEFHLYPGCFHGFEVSAPEAAVSKRATKEYIDAVKRALHRIDKEGKREQTVT